MAWNTIILSTTSTIKRHEPNVNNLGTWTDSISVARLKLGNDLIARIGNKLDDIKNPTTLILACDYLTLSLIYTSLSNLGLYEQYQTKKIWYYNLYLHLLQLAIARLDVGVVTKPTGYFQL